MTRYEANDVNPDMSMLELLDVVNEGLILKGEEPIAFEHDCREGICGSCGFMINGIAHGPLPATTVCQLSMRHFKDGQELYLEPWRARAFPVIKDLVVDRGAFDRIVEAGGYVSVPTGSAQDGNTIQGQPERRQRALGMVRQYNVEGFGSCTNIGECQAVCPKEISLEVIARMNRDFIGASLERR